MRPVRTVVLAAVTISLGVAVGGCTVDDDYLDTQRFPCSSSSECGEGWGCLRATPYAKNFCAPRCDATNCDGTCTGGEQSLCLRTCLIGPDGEAGSCQSDDYSCIRTSVERNTGVCHGAVSCETHDDCGDGERCLTQILRELEPDSDAPIDNFYCVPVPDEHGECPAGSEPDRVGSPGTPELCFPGCEVLDTRCPPGFACLTLLQRIAPYLEQVDGPGCYLGGYGLSCQDDTNCFVGSCLDSGTAQGRICTVTCNEASRLAGGCGGLVPEGSASWFLYRMECDPEAPSDDGSGLCVVRYATNFPGCTSEPGSAYECASGLECRQVSVLGTALCTQRCDTTAECNAGLGLDPADWLYQCRAGFCVFRSGG